jgi:hypothetical protein
MPRLLWRIKSEYGRFFLVMPVRSCRVTIKDMDGVKHTVEVTAETLYEAVALGLVALRGNDWVMGISQGLNTVQVSVVDIPIEHLCSDAPSTQENNMLNDILRNQESRTASRTRLKREGLG